MEPIASSGDRHRTEPSVGWPFAAFRRAPHGCDDGDNAGRAFSEAKIIHIRSRLVEDVGCHQPRADCIAVDGITILKRIRAAIRVLYYTKIIFLLSEEKIKLVNIIILNSIFFHSTEQEGQSVWRQTVPTAELYTATTMKFPKFDHRISDKMNDKNICNFTTNSFVDMRVYAKI